MIDQTLFSTIQRKLLEPADGGLSFPSKLWTHEELLRIANDSQDGLLQATHLLVGLLEIPEVADQASYDLPEDWLATVFVVRRLADGTYRLLDLMDTFQADTLARTWPAASSTPIACRDVEGPTRTLTLMPAPAAPTGTLLLYYVTRAVPLNADGELLTVPDEWSTPVLQYWMLETLLNKVGRGQDVPRSQYCRDRRDLGVAVTELLLRGLA